MCGRFSLGASAATLAAQFDLFEVPAWTPRYNIAPTQEVLVVVQDPTPSRRQARRHRWGLIPSWAKDPGIGNQLINAQAETAASKPAFRVAFRKRRSLILADGFYEWRKENRHKQPFHIRLRDGRPFGFAGLWEHWEGPKGKAIHSCTILTASPNELLRPLHHRMAVILDPAAYDLWLDPAIQEVDRLQALLCPYPVSVSCRGDDGLPSQHAGEQPGERYARVHPAGGLTRIPILPIPGYTSALMVRDAPADVAQSEW